MPAIRGLISGEPESSRYGAAAASDQGRPFRRQRNRARFRGRRETRGPRGARHVLPRSLPAHEDLAAGAALRSGARFRRAARRARRRPRSRPIASVMRAITTAASAPGSPKMRDANPVVYLVPGVGMITFAADKATARIAGEFYVNAINVMRGAASVSTYRGLPEQEAFDIEYWDLEEAKLQRMPKPKALAGRVALITGGAGGIGLATARRLMDEGACVVLCDIDRDALAQARKPSSRRNTAPTSSPAPGSTSRAKTRWPPAFATAPGSSAASTSASRTPASRRRRRSKTRRSRSGRRTWTSWPPAIS